MVVNILRSQSLALRRNAVQNIQGPLPDDQWKLDVTNWWNISLSALQAAFVDTAYGLSNPDVFRLQINATSSGQRSVCQNQVRMPSDSMKSLLNTQSQLVPTYPRLEPLLFTFK